MVCAGAILIAIFGAIGEPAHTLDQLLELLVRPAFLRWMAGTAVIIGVTLLGARSLKHIAVPGRTRDWAVKCRLSHPTTSHHSPRIKVLRGVLYGSVSGILSAHSLLIAKSAVELLVRTIVDRVNQFNRWQSWIILLGLIVFALTQLYYMHKGLKLCSTSILYPYVFCIYNIIAILDGLIYFHQASRLSGLHAGLIALGTVILLSGVLCLSWRLEEAPTHPGAGATAAAPTTPLGPGLGLLEEQRRASVSEFMYPSDEESLPAEREPLLSQTSQQRRSSFSYISPLHRRGTNATDETAEIWAELRDDEDSADKKSNQNQSIHSVLLPPPSPSSFRRFRKRRGRHSSLASIPSNQKHTFSLFNRFSEFSATPNGSDDKIQDNQSESGPSTPIASPRVRTWGSRHSQLAQQSWANWRRTSAPIVPESSQEPETIRHRDVSSNLGAVNRSQEGDGSSGLANHHNNSHHATAIPSSHPAADQNPAPTNHMHPAAPFTPAGRSHTHHSNDTNNDTDRTSDPTRTRVRWLTRFLPWNEQK